MPTDTFDGLSRLLLARDSVGAVDADVSQVHDSLSRMVEHAQSYDASSHHVTHSAFVSLVATQVSKPSRCKLRVARRRFCPAYVG